MNESLISPFNITHPTAVQTSLFASALFARFDPSGRYLGVGGTNGTAAIWDLETRARIRWLEGHVKAVTSLACAPSLRNSSRVLVPDTSSIQLVLELSMIARHKISGAGTLKGLDFAKSGRRLVTNSSDRTLRQFSLPTYGAPNPDGEFLDEELEPTHRFNDPINKTAWYGMSYSPDGEWLAGGAADPASHKIYIWDISNDGQFASALDGGREPLWHPSKSSIASTTNHGNILIWHCPNPERWGAFAGGFEEVDENIEYEEKEDEFDIEDEEEILKRKMKAEDEEVDIDTMAEDTTRRDTQPDKMDVEDEEFIWADQDAEDAEEFRMKILMQDESEL
ncbi:hypothetical protein DXG03_005305 [Asterophora parasitica]|uniref:WD40 repeat-like protein n=1 Tax=Asterophora parasitica TaxID=117018 RepID=A0A9P7GBN8_9AGAR|nr:hypothetical protein DXG03_005305 [Asterophora parasitica]